MSIKRTFGLAAALAVVPVAAAYRFALVYRVRAGYPRPHPPVHRPSAVGLAWEDLEVAVPSTAIRLRAWFIPARGSKPGPGVVLVHGWESARDRMLPQARFLHEASFHCLLVDVRGHGDNPAEALPLTAGEFGADAGAAFGALLQRPEVTRGAILGHSMGGIGAALAAAADPRVAAAVVTAAPADPWRLTRETFRLAKLPLPDPIAYPLAWLTARVYLRPRHHRVADISAAAAVARYPGPLLLVHGEDDHVVPLAHLDRLAAAARSARTRSGEPVAPVRTLVVPGGHHSWLYASPDYRATVASFLAEALDGPLDPAAAAAAARVVEVTRLPDAEAPFSSVEAEPGGFRTLASLARPGATAQPDEAFAG